jgi:hypothetical protein
MMKAMSLLVSTLLALWVSSPVFAAKTIKAMTNIQFGSAQLKDAQLKDLHHSGELELEKVKISGAAIINGHLQATESSFNDLTVNGQSELKESQALGTTSINGALETKESKFDGSLIVHGLLEAKNSTFKNVTITSSKINFKDCELQDLTIKSTKEDKQQILTLDDTTINGNVKFESGNGLIKMDKASKIAGKVTGGTVEK